MTVANGNSLGGVLRTKGALVLRECSYGLYISHGIVLSVLFVELRDSIAAVPTLVLPSLMPIAAMVAAAVTAATYLLVERPAMHLGRRIAQRWTGRRIKSDVPTLEVAL